jgi:hypothetical protein
LTGWVGACGGDEIGLLCAIFCLLTFELFTASCGR